MSRVLKWAGCACLVAAAALFLLTVLPLPMPLVLAVGGTADKDTIWATGVNLDGWRYAGLLVGEAGLLLLIGAEWTRTPPHPE